MSEAIETIKEQWAGHYSDGGSSDKVWAAALDGATMRSVWGKRGAALQHGEKTFASGAAATKEYRKKVASKVEEGYQPIPFDHASYGIPSFFPQNESGDELANVATTATAMPAITKIAEYVTSHVLPLDWEAVESAITSPLYGITEKVNGARCMVRCGADETLTAYNRKGQASSTVPAAALELAKLGCQFVLDGERLEGNQAGSFVIFDVLEWQGEDVRSWPYSQRIAAIESQMQAVNLIAGGAATHKAAQSQSLVSGLSLLVAEVDEVKSRQVIAEIQEGGLEGIIVRTLAAPYQPGDTKHVRKFKFLADVDCIVIGVKPGLATGSVRLGLIRPSDGAIIEVGSVRSGLVDAEINRLGQMVDRGERPVLKVEYLPVRTVGIQLVEPRTDITQLRTDKVAAECTTDQLGEAKAPLIATAKPASL